MADKLKETQRSNQKKRDEYIHQLNQWLWQCYHWQACTASLPYLSLSNNSSIDINRNFPGLVPNQNASTTNRTPNVERMYRIPSLLKRFGAELLDTLLLVLVKVFMTYIAVEFLHIMPWETLEIGDLRNELFSYKFIEEMSPKIFLLEAMHRVLVILYEAMTLSYGANGSIGGRTIGKAIFGLRVLSCHECVSTNLPNTYLIVPGQDIGFGCALLRAVLKNCAMTFMFPACVTVIFFPQNRALYDIVCRSVVVEEL